MMGSAGLLVLSSAEMIDLRSGLISRLLDIRIPTERDADEGPYMKCLLSESQETDVNLCGKEQNSKVCDWFQTLLIM